MKKILYVLLCAVWSLIVNAQQLKTSEISFLNKGEIKGVEEMIKANSKDKIKSFKGESYGSEKKAVVKNISKYFEHILEDSVYIHHPYFENRIEKVLGNIYKYNVSLNNPNRILLLRNQYTPNAASYGINVFEMNLGLFTLIDTDDELAFILCHELAHQYLKHLERQVEDKENSLNSDELKRKTNAIKKSNGPKSSKAIKLLKEISANLSEKSREFEIEADSLGMVYFQKTEYSLPKALSILQKMGTLEERLYAHKINWKETYNVDYTGYVNKNTMFKKRVIDADFKIHEDSVRTHPDIDLRIEKLGFSPKTLVDKQGLTEQQIVAFLSLGNQHKELEKSFYIYSFLHESFPEESKYILGLLAVIDEVYDCKKQHTLGKRIPSFINNYSKEKIYNDIIHFLHEVELQELMDMKTFLKQKL